ncbi:MAG: hypothetical protein U9N80_15745, partial [Chloroflexota bacterium]|nr:hypothetical protein [Chloroflexota bacterium]
AKARAGLLIWDVTTPSNPYELGSYYTASVLTGVYVQGQYAYLAAGDAGLIILDVSSPTNPVKVGSYNTSGQAKGVYVSGFAAFVADGSSGLRIFDVSTPSNPIEIAYYPAIDFVRNVTIHGTYAYLADDQAGLVILDVSNPYNPIPESVFTFQTDNPEKTNYVYDVVIQGGYAYVLDFDLVVLDVSNPSNPQQMSRTGLPGVGNFPGWGFNIAFHNDRVFVAGDMGGLAVYEVPNPQASPIEIAQFRTPGWSWDVDIQGNYAYMADDLAGLFIVDISNPAYPMEVGQHDSPSWSMGVEVEGNYAYVAAREEGLSIVDVSSPTSPSQVSSLILNLTGPPPYPGDDSHRYAYGLALGGSHVYITDNKDAFFAVDVSNVNSPSVMDSLILPETSSSDKAQNIDIEADYAYVAHFEHGVQAIDVSNPNNLVKVSDFCQFGASKDVWVSNGYAYVVGTEGLCIASVANPASPQVLSQLVLKDSVSIYEEDGYAYVGMEDGICLVKVSVPGNPELVECRPTYSYGGVTDYFYNVEYAHPYIYVAQGIVGLQVYEVETRFCGRLPIYRASHRIVIDGICDPLREWIDVFSIDISRTGTPVMLYIAVDRAGETLYIAIEDYGDSKLDEGDYSTIYFDENYDGSWPDEPGVEGAFTMTQMVDGVSIEYESMHLGRVLSQLESSGLSPEGVTGAMSDDVGHVQMEWMINLTESALNAGAQDTIGLYIVAGSGETVTGAIPLDGDPMDPSTFAPSIIGCQNVEECQAADNCDDGVDNDCDGDVDLYDVDCQFEKVYLPIILKN